MGVYLVRGVAAIQARIEADSQEEATGLFLEGLDLSQVDSCHWESRQVEEVTASELDDGPKGPSTLTLEDVAWPASDHRSPIIKEVP